MGVVQVALAVSGIYEAVMADSCFLPTIADVMDLANAADAVGGADVGGEAAETEASSTLGQPSGLRTPSIGDPGSLAHSTLEEIDAAVPDSWEVSPSNHGGGVRWSDPAAPGNQVRAMPGNPADPNPMKQSPYMRVSMPGVPHYPIPIDW